MLPAAPPTPQITRLPELPPLRDVVARFGLSPQRSLGQHFLFDAGITDRIAKAAGDLTNCTVYEVGPGPGGLTRSLLAAGAREVVAVESDPRCVAALQELAAAFPGRLRVIAGDALAFDEVANVPPATRVVANLPYNISTVLLLRWLPIARHFASFTLMFQREVALRLVAAPGTGDYGRLSVMIQWAFEPRRLFDVAAGSFVPPPKVTSTVVQLTPRQHPLAPAEHVDLEAVVAAAFGQRRKMLRTSLKSLGLDPADLLVPNGIDPMARGETLTVEQFCGLARCLRAARRGIRPAATGP